MAKLWDRFLNWGFSHRLLPIFSRPNLILKAPPRRIIQNRCFLVHFKEKKLPNDIRGQNFDITNSLPIIKVVSTKYFGILLNN